MMPIDRDVGLEPRCVLGRLEVSGGADQLRVAGDDQRPGEALDVVLARVLRPLDQLPVCEPFGERGVVHIRSLTDRTVSVNSIRSRALKRPHEAGEERRERGMAHPAAARGRCTGPGAPTTMQPAPAIDAAQIEDVLAVLQSGQKTFS